MQAAQVFLAAAVGERDQGMHKYSPFDCIHQRSLDLWAIKTENHDLDGLLSLLNAFDQAIDAVSRLDQQFHDVSSLLGSLL